MRRLDLHGITDIGGGRFRVRVGIGRGPDGKPVTISENLRNVTPSEAVRRRDEIERANRNPDAYTYGRMTVADFIEREYLPHLDLQPTTRRGYDATLRNHVRPLFGSLAVRDALPLHLSRALASIEKPGARLNAYKMLNAAFTFAVKNSVLVTSPMVTVKKPELPDYDPDVYSLDEVLDAFEAVRGMDIEPGILIAFSCGTRASETCALDWRDLDLDADTSLGAVVIDDSYHRVKGMRVTQPPKSKRSKRPIAIPGFVVERLLEIRGAGRIGPLMVDRTGQRMTPDGFSHRWRRLTTERLDKQGRVIYVPPVRHIELKNGRHSQSTILLDLGATMHAVAVRDGHSRDSTTDAFYGKRHAVADYSTAALMDDAVRQRRDKSGQHRAHSGGTSRTVTH